MITKKDLLINSYPELANEVFGYDFTNLDKDSHEKVDWKCKNNHIWVEKIINRTIHNKNCPKCDSK